MDLIIAEKAEGSARREGEAAQRERNGARKEAIVQEEGLLAFRKPLYFIRRCSFWIRSVSASNQFTMSSTS